MQSDADRYAHMDMQHELCDDNPCERCKQDLIRRVKNQYYAGEITDSEANELLQPVLEPLNEAQARIGKKYGKRPKPITWRYL